MGTVAPEIVSDTVAATVTPPPVTGALDGLRVTLLMVNAPAWAFTDGTRNATERRTRQHSLTWIIDDVFFNLRSPSLAAAQRDKEASIG